VIVGGGFAGVTAVRELTMRGRSAVLLEARDLGQRDQKGVPSTSNVTQEQVDKDSAAETKDRGGGEAAGHTRVARVVNRRWRSCTGFEQDVRQVAAERIAHPSVAERKATGKDAWGRTPP